ncbi:winged helix-turn-helix domain-containing protein [Streptomyces sp. NPDC006553]|uniref:GntR family transcriptional regulator n=1 Tax=Streptomyces sp. NPDC006553 TaxID=3157180 RepID=UPI0033BD652F
MPFVPEPLDPDDDRSPYEQVAGSLGAAIRTRRPAPGEKLPSHKELKELCGFARATVQRALRGLEDEGLVVSRKGSGVYVRNRAARSSSSSTWSTTRTRSSGTTRSAPTRSSPGARRSRSTTSWARHRPLPSPDQRRRVLGRSPAGPTGPDVVRQRLGDHRKELRP